MSIVLFGCVDSWISSKVTGLTEKQTVGVHFQKLYSDTHGRTLHLSMKQFVVNTGWDEVVIKIRREVTKAVATT